MENKHRKILQRAFKIISPDLDPTSWTDQEFQQVFINDVNFLLDHMTRRSKQLEEIKAKTVQKLDSEYQKGIEASQALFDAKITGEGIVNG